jgi:hypothetical protein
MGNSLGRNIAKGEQVVLKKHIFKDKDSPIERRVFVAESGFGMLHAASGRKIFGYWLDQEWYYGEEAEGIIYGYWIDKEATEQWQELSSK